MTPATPRRPIAGTRGASGFILPVVLVLVGLMTMLVAGFIWFVRAESAGMHAHVDAQQARLAAESGLEDITALLRQPLTRDDVGAWYNVPQRWRNALVWASDFDRESDPARHAGGSREQIGQDGPIAPAWRYSVVAANLDNSLTIRYGITPEGGRLNINAASDYQIEQLLTPILMALEIDNYQQHINALLDWRDPDDTPREGGVENEYYNLLEPAYSSKDGPLDTIEEILLVKGWNAAMLYGEDTNQNGVLDPNEDDGDQSFPPYDNADGILDPGVAPFLTLWSREPDTAIDNKQRINMNSSAAIISAQIADTIMEGELSPETLSFIVGLKQQQGVNFEELGSPAGFYYDPNETDEDGSADADQDGTGEPTSQPSSQPRSPQFKSIPNSPVKLEEMPVIMDRFSTRPVQQAQQPIAGLVNINTAPFRVLVLVPGMTPEAAGAIVSKRQELSPEALRTTAWPLVSGAVDARTFRNFAPYVTTKSYQFHVEVIGYADHLKMVRRFEWIVEMVGSLAQVKYYRDLTSLGRAWPIDDDNFSVTSTVSP